LIGFGVFIHPMADPLVSVVTGTFNKAAYVRQTVESVLAQTFSDFEYLVVDDRSTDGTREILHAFGDRICLVEREANSGVPGIPRNQGVLASRGKYIAFLDADDLWDPEKLESQVAFMEAHPEIPFSHTGCRVIDASGVELRVRHEGALPPTGNCFKALLNHCWVTTSTVMLRRSLSEQMGGMLEDVQWRTGEDYEYYMRIAARHPMGLLEGVLASYRSQGAGESVSQESCNWKGMPEYVPVLIHLLEHPEIWEGVADREDLRRALRANCLENGYFWLEHGRKDRARWFARTLFKHKMLEMSVFELLLKSLR
jgi:teichuronic acid biosynthesis glycosyltransferase TuaG